TSTFWLCRGSTFRTCTDRSQSPSRSSSGGSLAACYCWAARICRLPSTPTACKRDAKPPPRTADDLHGRQVSRGTVCPLGQPNKAENWGSPSPGTTKEAGCQRTTCSPADGKVSSLDIPFCRTRTEVRIHRSPGEDGMQRLRVAGGAFRANGAISGWFARLDNRVTGTVGRSRKEDRPAPIHWRGCGIPRTARQADPQRRP